MFVIVMFILYTSLGVNNIKISIDINTKDDAGMAGISVTLPPSASLELEVTGLASDSLSDPVDDLTIQLDPVGS